MDLKKLQDQWLGDKKIKFATEGTIAGLPVVIVTFDNNATEVYTAKMLESEGVVTPLPQDLTAFREKRVNGVVRDCLIVIREYNLREKELNYTMQKLEASIIENIRAAQRMLWKIENDGEETFLQIHEVLLSQKQKEDKSFEERKKRWDDLAERVEQIGEPAESAE